jgi:hypothetical protein
VPGRVMLLAQEQQLARGGNAVGKGGGQ